MMLTCQALSAPSGLVSVMSDNVDSLLFVVETSRAKVAKLTADLIDADQRQRGSICASIEAEASVLSRAVKRLSERMDSLPDAPPKRAITDDTGQANQADQFTADLFYVLGLFDHAVHGGFCSACGGVVTTRATPSDTLPDKPTEAQLKARFAADRP